VYVDDFHLYLEAKGYKEPDDQRHSPYTWKAGHEGKTVWEVMAQYPERLHAFQAGLDHLSNATPLTGFYDFGRLDTKEDRPILVDVGGGVGNSIMRILRAHPGLSPAKFVLQDLQEPIEQAKSTISDGVRLMIHDFNTEQPVKGMPCN
jgi:hypothetical protein